MKKDFTKVLKECVNEYNKYRSPEAKVEITGFKKSKIILKFSGYYRFTCGVYDYFEDFIHLLEEKNMRTRIINISEKEDGHVVEVKVLG